MWTFEYIKNNCTIKELNDFIQTYEKKEFKGLPMRETTFLGSCWTKNWFGTVYNGIYNDIVNGSVDADFFIMNDEFTAKVNKQFKIPEKEQEFTSYNIYKLTIMVKIRILKEVRAKKSKAKKYAYSYEDEL